jgi:diguanylate cyclase (GGDEF)-like protein
MNRRAFDQAARAVLEQSRRRSAPLALAVVDVDNFKEINDSLGHAEGDRVLASVAGSLRAYFRQGDLVGRLGGDEFAVLLPDTSGDQAEQRFRDLHRRLLEEAARQDWPIGFSIGVASFEQPLASLDESLQVADALMYRVKNAGKNAILIEPVGPGPSSGPGQTTGPADRNHSRRVAGRTG